MKRNFYLILMLLSVLAFRSYADLRISGTVYGADDKKPLPGVSVMVAAMKSGVATDANGAYSISVPDEKDTLVFAYVGYETQKVAINKSDKLDVYLKPSQHALNEVVIVGYGAHRKQELSGAVSIVAPSLQGRVAGVSVEGKSKQRMLYKPLYPGGYNSESYKSIKENGFLKPQNQPLSTFATDVDAASVISGALSTTGSYLLKKPFG